MFVVYLKAYSILFRLLVLYIYTVDILHNFGTIKYFQVVMSPKSRQKLFQLHENEIHQILFCENSDAEDALELDKEDLSFLEINVKHVEKNLNSDINCDSMEVVIEPPLENSTSVANNTSHMQTFAKNSAIVEKSILKKDFDYIRKITKPT